MSNRFGQDHDDLRVIMHRFAALLVAGKPDRATLARERFAFSRVFGPHVIAEERLLDALPTASLSPAAVRTIATYRDRFRALRLDYSAQINEWTVDAIERDWPGYGRAVIDLQRRLFEMMTWEERVIHPLIAPAAPLKGPTSSTGPSSRAPRHTIGGCS